MHPQRNRPGGLLKGIEKAYLDAFVRPLFDPKMDGGNWDTTFELDADFTAKPRPSRYEEQINALLAEQPASFAEMMDRFIEECRGEVE